MFLHDTDTSDLCTCEIKVMGGGHGVGMAEAGHPVDAHQVTQFLKVAAGGGSR